MHNTCPCWIEKFRLKIETSRMQARFFQYILSNFGQFEYRQA